MNPQSVSIISTLVNLGLGITKLIFGYLISSVALVADGLHSSLDVLSSFITFLGLRASKKPVDEKHPYGHWKAEGIAGFIVTLFLAVTGIWILFEAVKRFNGGPEVTMNLEAVGVVIVSIVVTEIMARVKFYYGGRYRSLALVADGEHSRADALSSIGVLAGLFLARYFNLADAIIALGIGLYILYEAFHIGKEVTDSLLDVADQEVEGRIKKICASHRIEISGLKTRKIGSFVYAEIKIKLPAKLKVEDVQKITQTLEDRLVSNIQELKQIVISIESYDLSKSIILPRLGKKIGELEGFEEIGPKKLGFRTIVPVGGEKDAEKLAKLFGAKWYLVFDRRSGEIISRQIVKNPYFELNSPHGARFAKAIRADKIITAQIGPNAKQSLENFGITIQISKPESSLKSILEEENKNVS